MALNTAVAVGAADYYRTIFENEVASATPFYTQLCTTIQSERESEPYVMLGSVPGVREWLGERQFKQLRASDYRLLNKHFESSLMFDKDKLADAVGDFYTPAVRQLAVEAAYHPDEMLIDALVVGESSTGWDGKNFFAAAGGTAHVWGDSGSQANSIGSIVVSTTAVTAAEMRTAFNAARMAMVKYKNDQGKFLNRTTLRAMSNLMMLVPPELQLAAEEAMMSSIAVAGTALMSNMVLDRPRVVSSPLLTTATKFYLFNLASPLRPFIFQDRQPLRTATKGEDDGMVKDISFGVDARYNLGYGQWTSAVLVTLATS